MCYQIKLIIVKIFQSEKKIGLIKKISEEKGIDMTKCESIALKIKSEANKLLEKSISCITDRSVEVKERSESLKKKIKGMHITLSQMIVANEKCVEDQSLKNLHKLRCLHKVNNHHLLI